MKYLNIELSTLRSAEYVGSSPAGRERAAFRRERIRYFITQKQIEVREPSGIHHFAAHGGTNKTHAHQAGVQQINPRERENEKRQSSQCNN